MPFILRNIETGELLISLYKTEKDLFEDNRTRYMNTESLTIVFDSKKYDYEEAQIIEDEKTN